jgi:hypothetical protein
MRNQLMNRRKKKGKIARNKKSNVEETYFVKNVIMKAI